jgi:TPR repeat protein
MALLEEELGQFGLARQWTLQALELFPRIEAEHLGRAQGYLDWRRSLAEKVELYEEAPRAVRDLNYALSKPGKQAASLLLMRVSALAQQGKDRDIPETAEKLRELSPKDADHLYDVACCYGIAAVAATDEKQALSHQRRAMATLREAIAAGFNNADHMRSDPDLRALRDRDDFQKLVTELQK